MDELQQQVEQFHMMHLNDEGYCELCSLLRKVVEECCRYKCDGCWNGRKLDMVIEGTERMPRKEYFHPEIQQYCEASNIRGHFDWLLETKETE